MDKKASDCRVFRESLAQIFEGAKRKTNRMSSKVEVLLNRRSGSANAIASRIVADFRNVGLECELRPIERHVDLPKLARDAASRADTVVVSAGGDGTVNAVAAGVAGTGFSMGVLPAGTLNHFARDLGIPLDLDRAIRVIAERHESAVDTGEVNGHLFVNNSSVGIYPAMVSERELLEKSGLSKWLSLVLASARAFVRFHCIVVQLTVNGESITRRTPILFVGNNEYRMEGKQIGTRERLDGGTLFVYVAPDLTRAGMFRIALAALYGKVKDVSNYEQFSVTELTVDLHRRVCRVSLDGEVRQIRGPLRYRIRPGSLKVFTPGPA